MKKQVTVVNLVGTMLRGNPLPEGLSPDEVLDFIRKEVRKNPSLAEQIHEMLCERGKIRAARRGNGAEPRGPEDDLERLDHQDEDKAVKGLRQSARRRG